MNCKLCLKESKLCKSHIIPEYFYKHSYDSKHRYLILSSEGLSNKKYYDQIGYRELLFCLECESKLNNWEKYISDFFEKDIYGEIEKKLLNPSLKVVFFEGLKYDMLKFFQLSILWRASISKLDFFERIKLDPIIEENLRLILLSEKLCEPMYLPCMMTFCVKDNILRKEFINQPLAETTKTNEKLIYFVFGGFVWTFFLNSSDIPIQFRPTFLDKLGRITILKKDIQEIKFLMNHTNQLDFDDPRHKNIG